MTKGRFLTLIIAAAVLAALVIGSVVLITAPVDPSGTNQLKIYGVTAKDVQSVEIAHNGETVGIYRADDGKWKFEGSDAPVDQARAESVITFVSYVYVTKAVDENVTDFAKYGLDPPQSVVKVNTVDGGGYTINYGYQTADNTSKYMRMNDDPTVYIQGYLSSELILRDLDALRDLKLPAFDVEQLSEIAYQNTSGETVGMNILANGLSVGNCAWQMNQPAALFVPTMNVDSFKAILKSAKLSDYIGAEVKPEYGLDEYAKLAQFGFADGTMISLKIGAQTEDGKKYYCLVDGKDGVYTIGSSALEFLGYSSLQMALPEIMPAMPADTTAIAVSANGQTYDLKTDGSAYTLNDKTITGETYDALFTAMKQMIIVDYVKPDVEIGAEVASVTQSCANGAEVAVKLYEYGKDFLAVDYGFGNQIYIARAPLDEFISKLAAV